MEAVSSGEKQQKGVRGHSLAASTSRLGVKGGWLERALPQAGQGWGVSWAERAASPCARASLEPGVPPKISVSLFLWIMVFTWNASSAGGKVERRAKAAIGYLGRRLVRKRQKEILIILLSAARVVVGRKDYDPQRLLSDFPIYFRSIISCSLMFPFSKLTPSSVALWVLIYVLFTQPQLTLNM